jgi:hypothetical protein
MSTHPGHRSFGGAGMLKPFWTCANSIIAESVLPRCELIWQYLGINRVSFYIKNGDIVSKQGSLISVDEAGVSNRD